MDELFFSIDREEVQKYAKELTGRPLSLKEMELCQQKAYDKMLRGKLYPWRAIKEAILESKGKCSA
jgi:hypothetical protein